MDYQEFQRHIQSCGLKLNEFAYLMGMKPTSVSNKRTQGVPRHLAIVVLFMSALARNGIDVRELVREMDAKDKKVE